MPTPQYTLLQPSRIKGLFDEAEATVKRASDRRLKEKKQASTKNGKRDRRVLRGVNCRQEY